MTTNDNSNNRYSRQTAAYGEACGRRIFSSACVVAWNSTLCSTAVVAETVKNLALSGIREIHLIDADDDNSGNGAALDLVMDVSSNSLTHPYILSNADGSSNNSKSNRGVGSLLLAFRQGLLELNSSLIVHLRPVRKNASVCQENWFERVGSEVSMIFDEMRRQNRIDEQQCNNNNNNSSIGCFLLCHPYDRRECPQLADMFSRLEQENNPYTHVQTAGVFGRVTNNFGRNFVVADPSPAQPTQATISKIGVLPLHNEKQPQDKAESSHCNNHNNNSCCCFVELVAEDTEADAAAGSAVNVGDSFNLVFTGDSSNNDDGNDNENALSTSMMFASPLLHHYKKLVAAASGRFVIDRIQEIVCPVTSTKTLRYIFNLFEGHKQVDPDLQNLLVTFCRAAHAGRFPLRYSQVPNPVTIENFDVACQHHDDIADTTMLFRTLTMFCCRQEQQQQQLSQERENINTGSVMPRIQNKQDVDVMSSLLLELATSSKTSQDASTPDFLKLVSPELSSLKIRQFSRTARLQPSFFATYLGAFVAQEVLKFFTQKWMPMTMPICFDMAGVLPSSALSNNNNNNEQVVDKNDFFPNDALLDGENSATMTPDIHYSAIFGASQLEKLRNAKLFLVGAGALGCEYVKIFALMGLCSGGKGVLTLTDDDNIAVSNLSRQLLFRPQHVGKNKSVVAAEAATSIAKLVLKHRGGSMMVRALQLRLDAKSTNPISGVFNHRFWSQQAVLLSGVDNVKARAYLSEMSQQHLLPLIDGGTSGPLGHVASILPFVIPPLEPPQTENKNIPVCTLHFFPTTVAHCSHHALNTFRNLFGESTTTEDVSEDGKTNQKSIIATALRRAVSLWFPIFVQPILDLRKAKPPHAVEADGVTPYYAAGSARRCPEVPIFDPLQDSAHRNFVVSTAKLWLRYHNLIPQEAEEESQDDDESNNNHNECIDEILAELAVRDNWSGIVADHVKSYVPKAAVIPNDTSSAANHQQDENEESEQVQEKNNNNDDDVLPPSSPATEKTFPASAMDFEKDDDDHLTFVWAATVVRARAYSIFAPTKSDVQRVAGRMVPALITTTAAVVAGGTYNTIALLLHHNPQAQLLSTITGNAGAARPKKPANNLSSSSKVVLEPIANVTRQDLQKAAAMLLDYQMNLADGNNSFFSFQQVMDTTKEIDLDVLREWRRIVVKVPDDSSFSVANLIFDLLKRYRTETSLSSTTEIPLLLQKVIDSNLQNPCDIEKYLSVILKIKIGVSEQVAFQYTLGTASQNGGMMTLLPAHYLIKQTLMNSDESNSNNAAVIPPFVECELFVHAVGGENGNDNDNGLTILARLQL